jgi:L-asparaginase
VSLITAGLGVGDRDVEAAVAAGAQGIVVAAAGAGATHPSLFEGGRRAIARGIPVVLATRCHAGSVGTAYAYPGGGGQWARSGAILAGTLSPVKCRVALALGLGAGLDRAELDRLFERYRTSVGEAPPDDSPELRVASSPRR